MLSRLILNRGTPIVRKTPFTFMSKNFIHYENKEVKDLVLKGQKKSPLLNVLVQNIEQSETRKKQQLMLRLNGLSPEHDIRKIPFYMDNFINHYEDKISLKIVHKPSLPPYYLPDENRVSVMMLNDYDALGHELTHHWDKITKSIRWSMKEHHLAAELHAFHIQYLISQQLGLKKPLSWDKDKLPFVQALTYEGKKHYRGFVTGSIQEVIKYIEYERELRNGLNEAQMAMLEILLSYQKNPKYLPILTNALPKL